MNWTEIYLFVHYYILTHKYCYFGRIGGFGGKVINISFLITKSWKWNTPMASWKTFIYLMNFYLSLGIHMYPKYRHFWAFCSLQHTHRCCIWPCLMFVQQSRIIYVIYIYIYYLYTQGAAKLSFVRQASFFYWRWNDCRPHLCVRMY